MKKLLLVLPLLTACNDNHHNNAPQYVQPPQAYTQEQYAQPVVQPQYAPQPQYVQPQQPVVIQQESSGVGSFVAGAAAGALAGHVYNKMNESDTHAPSFNRSYTPGSSNYSGTATPPVIPAAKPSNMDMAKLSESTKQPLNTSPTPATPKPGSMDMSRLSPPRTPSVSISKPAASAPRVGGMNMSRLSSNGRR